MKKLIVTILLQGVCFALPFYTIYSQTSQDQNTKKNGSKGEITGTVVDADSSKPLQAATVKLSKSGEAAVLTGAITDHDGKFTLKNIPYGEYTLNVSFISYRNKEIKPVLLSETKPVLNLRPIKLQSGSVNARAVVVTAEKEMVESSFDRTVINVEKNIATTGGSAIEAMRTIPSVSVDAEGTISLRGSQDLQILIDGKPSGLSNADVLEMIPASSIEKIELLTNPSVQYEAGGAAGIINIVLTKESSSGMNGLVSLTAGTMDKYNPSLSLNYKTSGINFFGSYNARYLRADGYQNIDQSYLFPDSSSYFHQQYDKSRNAKSHSGNFAIDYGINDWSTITFSALYNFSSRLNHEVQYNSTYNSQHIIDNYYTRVNDEDFTNHGLDYSLSYKLNLGKKAHELSAIVFYSPSARNYIANYENQKYIIDSSSTVTPSSEPPSLSRTTTLYNNYNLTAQLDYNFPFDNGGKLGVGYKSTVRHADMSDVFENYDYNSSVWQNDAVKTNHFIYTETVHALYILYADHILGLKYQLGLRGEFSNTQGNQLTIKYLFQKNYFDLFPTAHFNYDINDVEALQLSYSRRIVRPSLRQLNPFIDYEDPLNLEAGNPDLNPAYVNTYEGSHSLNVASTTLKSTLFYKQTGGAIDEVRALIDSNSIVTITRPLNLLAGKIYGVEFVAEQSLFQWWKANANFSYNKTVMYGSYQNIDLSNSGYVWNVKVNSTITFEKALEIQCSGFYYSPEVVAQGVVHAFYSADVGLKWNVLDRIASINFRVSDVLNTLKNTRETSTNNFYSFNERKRETRVAYLGFTYRFNGYNRTEEEKPDAGGVE